MKNMVEVKWDGDQIQQTFPESTCLGDLVESASKKARENGEFVCAISVNDLNLNEDQENKFKATPIGEIRAFAIKTQNLNVLLDQSIEEARVFLGQLIKSIDKAAEIFRTDDLYRAHQFYRTCIDGTQLFVEMVTHYKVAHQKNFGSPLESWSGFEQKLAEGLRQVLEAYRQKNYILVADLLEYEVSQILLDWQKKLSKAESKVGASEASSPNC
jgi:hypothetical protein